MAMRMVKSPSREDGSAGCHAGPDAVSGLNGHRAALGPETGTNWPELSSSGPAEEGAAFALTLRLDRMARQTAGLAQRVEELETELKQRGRRLQQLMGERDELRSLLARRDVELSRLHREIGAIGARAGPAAGRRSGSFAAARRLLDKLGRARVGLGRPDPGSLQRSPPDGRTAERRLVPWIKDRPPKEVLAVVLFGLSEAEIEAVLGVVERYCTEREIAPLLLTDHDAFELFRTRRVLLEFLPARSEQQRFAPELDWRLYTLRRLALIRRKWQPMRVVAFGRRATEVVKVWCDSPFEVTPIPAALNGSGGGAEFSGRLAQPSA